MTKHLNWPGERARSPTRMFFRQWHSNVCLDLHGDPRLARLVGFLRGPRVADIYRHHGLVPA